MIPSAVACVVLALGTFRLARLAGWDDFPPIARVRAWAVGEEIHSAGSTNARMGLTNEDVGVTYTYRRPLLHKLVTCPWCASWWIALVIYLAWRWEPTWTLTAAAPFALAAAVGLIAKQWDP